MIRYYSHCQELLTGMMPVPDTCINFLMILTLGLHRTLLCWDWAKAKITANITIGIPLHSCNFNPVDVAMISTIGEAMNIQVVY
jgi:hypothetical protein